MKVLEEKINGKEIKVFEATGYNDGYYWDMNAVVEYDGDIYHIVDCGSGSGYIPCSSGVVKGEFDRLYGEEQHEIDEDEFDYFAGQIATLLNTFIDSGAKESWEIQDDFLETRVYIDGEKVVRD